MYNISKGLFFLKGAPLTKGHVSAIIRAVSQVDELHVVLCWDEKFQKTLTTYQQKVQTKINRTLWLTNTFKHYNNIKISVVDESNIKGYPDGEAEFTKLLMNEVYHNYKCSHFDKVFSSEIEYNGYFQRNFPDSKIVLIDPERKMVDISATRVRNNLSLHWDYISKEAQKDFVKKVCIIGVESSGKSTLAINLAQYYGTQYVEEVGRTICENELGCSESTMTIEDYEYIAMKHKCKEREYLKDARKVLFSDTNNFITLFSAMCMGKDSQLLREMVKKEDYDLIIFLDCDVEWVYDPLRLNSTPEKRQQTFQLLKDLCEEFNIQYKMVSGNYYNRFTKSVKLVDELLERS